MRVSQQAYLTHFSKAFRKQMSSAKGSANPLYVLVQVYADHVDEALGRPIKEYVMDHNDPVQRKVLGAQCRAVFQHSHQIIVTQRFEICHPSQSE